VKFRVVATKIMFVLSGNKSESYKGDL